MSSPIQSPVNVDTKREKIKCKIEKLYNQFENEEQDNDNRKTSVIRNILFVGLSMSGKTTMRRVVNNPRIPAEESILRAQSQTDVTWQRDVDIASLKMTLNMVELPERMINGTHSLSLINDECENLGIHDFHLICLCISFVAGIDGTAIEAFERLIKHLGQDEVKPNLCLIITSCESKTEVQRERLRKEFLDDVGSEFVARHLGQGVQFFGALNRDDWDQANTSLLGQFETILKYRKKLLQLIRSNIHPFHVPTRQPEPVALPATLRLFRNTTLMKKS